MCQSQKGNLESRRPKIFDIRFIIEIVFAILIMVLILEQRFQPVHVVFAECDDVVAIRTIDKAKFNEILNELQMETNLFATKKGEFSWTEPNLNISWRR